MRSQRLLVLVLALTGLLLGACAWSRVTHVVDGDTIDVQITGPDTDGILVQGETYRVRLIGIDTPEVYGQTDCYGPEASAFVKQLIEGTDVFLEKDVSNVDRYGRLLRYGWAELDPSRDGLELLNEEIVRPGYARVATYPPDVKYVDRFLAAEQYARDNNLGLWGACNGAPPPSGNCDPSYPDVCIPPPPPDLDCADIPYRNFRVLPPDPHHFDSDGNGIGCEG